MELKSAKPKSRLRYLRILFFIPAIVALGVMAYCIWQIFPWFVAMAIAAFFRLCP
ncbi:hypothetical protein [Pseudanabaena sp. UWO311]|uniref:hypothetical protein n=1 Tax=Pseudanabaena sp. UWO311 TaxID=2487337 RepID=UPI00167FECA1|nr:hypothetical protein [Pseudanabaena sp. UWO311]